MPSRFRFIVALAFAAGAANASAQACAGFTDVEPGSLFCPNVEWLKNRQITLGCTSSTLYCPDLSVTRLAMAAFMNRLGKALSPEIHKDHVTLTSATIPGEPPANPLLLCSMAGSSTVTAYPRTALLNATVTGLADGNPVAWRAYWLYTVDGGVTYQTIMDAGSPISTPRASAAANQWSGVALTYALDLPANAPLSVRVVVRRDNVLLGTTGNFANARCQMTVAIVNANGTSSPF